MELLKQASKIYEQIEKIDKEIEQLKNILEYSLQNDYELSVSLPSIKQYRKVEKGVSYNEEDESIDTTVIYATSPDEAKKIFENQKRQLESLKKEVERNTFKFNPRECVLIVANFLRTKEDTRENLVKAFNKLETSITLK